MVHTKEEWCQASFNDKVLLIHKGELKKNFWERDTFSRIIHNDLRDTLFTTLSCTTNILSYGEMFIRNLVHAFRTVIHAF